MAREHRHPPSAACLSASMRDLGYSLETAIADLIDNSISAGADVINIICDVSGDHPALVILDNGRGMNQSELLAAMRHGTGNPRQQRSPQDLGRFGLGLKTASFSQCRSLTVVSNGDDQTCGAEWDLDRIDAADDWVLSILDEADMRGIRGRRLGMIFQEPMTSMNPVLKVGEQIAEVLVRHLGLGWKQAHREAIALLDRVGIQNPEQRAKQYIHQLSGGMRQRVMIAIAISGEPHLLIADEPTTALDVTIQAQILDLMRQIREEKGMSILLISHDLGVIADMCDRIAVMYAGQIVEEGTAEAVLENPKHPYTIGLKQSVPTPQKKYERLFSIQGTVPGLRERGPGCTFNSRCAHATDRCFAETPALYSMNGQQSVRCFLVQEEGVAVYGAG